MKKTIVINDTEVSYELNIKNVKNINLLIRANGSISVSANRYASMEKIESVLTANADAVVKAWEKSCVLRTKGVFPIHYVSGEYIQLLGKIYTLSVVRGTHEDVTIDRDNVILTLENPSDTRKKIRLLDRWLLTCAKYAVEKACRKVYPFFAKRGISYPAVKYRKMTSQWANCRPELRVLTFNTWIVMAPEECIESVAAHEFTHFLHPDHSKAFYAALTECMPDWRERDKLLGSTVVPF